MQVNFKIDLSVEWEDYPTEALNEIARKDIDQYIKMFMKQMDVIPLCVEKYQNGWVKDCTKKVIIKIEALNG